MTKASTPDPRPTLKPTRDVGMLTDMAPPSLWLLVPRRWRRRTAAPASPMKQRHVTLSGDVEGSFVVEKALAAGRFVVAPERKRK